MEKITSMSTITPFILREARFERNLQSANFAEMVNKSPSAWAKIETGRSPLSIDTLFLAAKALWTPPSAIIAAVERYSSFLSQNNWSVIISALSPDEDNFIDEAQKYYSSPGFKRRCNPVNGYMGYSGFGVSVLNSPMIYQDGQTHVIDLFRFVVDKDFKTSQEAC